MPRRRRHDQRALGSFDDSLPTAAAILDQASVPVNEVLAQAGSDAPTLRAAAISLSGQRAAMRLAGQR